MKNENISTSLHNLAKVDYYRTKELDNSVLLLRYTLYTAPVQHQIHVKQFTNKCDLKCKAKSIKKQKPNQNCFDITRKVKSHLFSSVELCAQAEAMHQKLVSCFALETKDDITRFFSENDAK